MLELAGFKGNFTFCQLLLVCTGLRVCASHAESYESRYASLQRDGDKAGSFSSPSTRTLRWTFHTTKKQQRTGYRSLHLNSPCMEMRGTLRGLP